MDNNADNAVADTVTCSESFYDQHQHHHQHQQHQQHHQQQHQEQWTWPCPCPNPECQRRSHEAAVQNQVLTDRVKYLEQTVQQMNASFSGWMPGSWSDVKPKDESAMWGGSPVTPTKEPASWGGSPATPTNEHALWGCSPVKQEPAASTSADTDSASSRRRTSRSSSSASSTSSSATSTSVPWPRVRDLVRRLLVMHLGAELSVYSISGQRRDHRSRPVPAGVMASVAEAVCREFVAYRLCAADVKAQVRVVLQNCYQNFLTKERKFRVQLQREHLLQEGIASAASISNNNNSNNDNVNASIIDDMGNLDYSPRLVIDDVVDGGQEYSFNPDEDLAM